VAAEFATTLEVTSAAWSPAHRNCRHSCHRLAASARILAQASRIILDREIGFGGLCPAEDATSGAEPVVAPRLVRLIRLLCGARELGRSRS